MPQLTRDQCQANAGSTCVQGGCPSGSTTLGVCSDVANYSCCSNAYTNPTNPGPTTGGTSTQNNGPFNYTLLERIPGGETAGGDLETYVENIYRIALIIVTLSAVLMLSVGGFMYLTSAGNTSAMGSAKSVIFDSLIGLVIAIVAWLILNVINPDLVNVTLNGFSTTPVSSGTPATGTAPAAQTGFVTLGEQGIPVRPAGNVCSTGGGAGNEGCQIGSAMASKLATLANDSRISGWWVTEAYPPTRTHRDPCHQAGTCVDASFSGASGGTTPERARQFIESASAAGIRAQLEVKTQVEKDALVAGGVSADKVSVLGEWINGTHFSLYNQ